jgi:hypothetical protein
LNSKRIDAEIAGDQQKNCFSQNNNPAEIFKKKPVSPLFVLIIIVVVAAILGMFGVPLYYLI